MNPTLRPQLWQPAPQFSDAAQAAIGLDVVEGDEIVGNLPGNGRFLGDDTGADPREELADPVADRLIEARITTGRWRGFGGSFDPGHRAVQLRRDDRRGVARQGMVVLPAHYIVAQLGNC